MCLIDNIPVRLPDAIESVELPCSTTGDGATVQDVHVVKTFKHTATEDNLQSLPELAKEKECEQETAPVSPPMFIKLKGWKKEIPLDCGCKCDAFYTNKVAVNNKMLGYFFLFKESTWELELFLLHLQILWWTMLIGTILGPLYSVGIKCEGG